MLRIEEIRKFFHSKKCKWCGTPLISEPQFYPHPDGFEVEGFSERQWVYVECPKCGYQWSLVKLMRG